MGVQKYVGRVKEQARTSRRHSTFYVVHGTNWVNSVERHAETTAELMRLSPNKRKYYQQGRQAVKLIKSAL